MQLSPKYHESCLIRRQGKARSAHVQFHKSLLIITFFIKFLDILLKTTIIFVYKLIEVLGFLIENYFFCLQLVLG